MTVSEIPRRALYTSDGSTTQYPFSFRVFADSDIAVYVSSDSSTTATPEQLTLGTDYTVTLEDDGTGTVVLAEALASGYQLAILSEIPQTQEMRLTNQGAFYPTVINDSADKLTALIQQVDEKVERAVLVESTSPTTPAEFVTELLAAKGVAKDYAEQAAESAEISKQVAESVEEYSWDIPHLVNNLDEVEAYPHDGYFWVKGYGDAGVESDDISNRTATATGGSVTRSLAKHFADIVNVRDFGAVGDGSTDDTAALQAAFAKAFESGSDVFFPAGVYCVSAQVQFGGDLCVFAYGATIKASDTENYTMLANTLGYDKEAGIPAGYGGNSNVYWYGGTIDGNCQASATSVLRQAMAFHHAQNIHVEDITFKNCRRAHTLEFGGCKDVVVVKCGFFGQYPPEISDYYPEVIQLNPNTEAATPTVYADGTENQNILIDGCLVTNAENTSEITASSPYAGIGSHGNDPGARCENIVIRNCTLRGIRHRGVTCSNTMFYGWKVNGCTFDGIGAYAIHITHRNDGTEEQKNISVGNFEINGNTFLNVPVAIYQSGFSSYYQDNISITNNTAEVTSQFASLHYANNIVVANNSVLLDAGSLSGSVMSCYFSGVNSPKLINYRLTTKNTDNVGSLYAATISTGCTNVSFSGVYSDRTQPPVNLISTTVDGIHGDYSNLRVFSAKPRSQDGTYYSAPAIALVSSDPYSAPQIGYPAGKAFWVGAFEDDANGRSVMIRRALLLYGDNDNANYAYAFCPAVTDTQNLGTASNKWKEVYAGTGSINTSDERSKANISDPGDALMRAWGRVGFKVFQFKDAIEEKGEAARLHVGVIAQQVREAFAAEGLDADRYGLFCHDQWDDEFADIEVEDSPAVVAADGAELEPARSHLERTLVRAAGDSYGIRYSEALALECAYQRWQLEQIKARLEGKE